MDDPWTANRPTSGRDAEKRSPGNSRRRDGNTCWRGVFADPHRTVETFLTLRPARRPHDRARRRSRVVVVAAADLDSSFLPSSSSTLCRPAAAAAAAVRVRIIVIIVSALRSPPRELPDNDVVETVNNDDDADDRKQRRETVDRLSRRRRFPRHPLTAAASRPSAAWPEHRSRVNGAASVVRPGGRPVRGPYDPSPADMADRVHDGNHTAAAAAAAAAPLCLAALSDWVRCVCVVTFDLEFGQVMEVRRYPSVDGRALWVLYVRCCLQMVYPDNVSLSEEDKTNLCYLAFPDSNSGCMGDTQFHVKIKCSQPTNLSQRHINYNAKCPVFLQADHRCLYGFVYFRQIKDLSLPRGYFQKVCHTIVILCIFFL